MDYTDLSSEHINDHIDRIIDVAESIEPGKVTILTGRNSSGKSVVRKLLGLRMMEKLSLNEAVTKKIKLFFKKSLVIQKKVVSLHQEN